MSSPDPFAFLDRQKARLAGEVDEQGEPAKPDPFGFLATGEQSFRFVEEEDDVGIRTAFGSGVKEGFLAPTRVLGREPNELELDETSEDVANAVGEFVGLGIGFIPFAKGAGIALKGIGLTARVSPEVAQFLKFTLAGTAQAAGTAEELEDVPRQAALGFAFGVAIDGMFLARAMRGRADDLARVNRNLAGNGSPEPAQLVSAETLAKEIELKPGIGKSNERLADEVVDLADETKDYNQVLMDLLERRVETVRIPDIEDVTPLMSYVHESFPDAQILVRPVAGKRVKEMLVHNPVDDLDRLTPKQIAQWKGTGAFENMGVIYRGQVHVATGQPVAPGRIQIRSLDKNAVFAPLKSEITSFLTPKVLSPTRQLHVGMQEALANTHELGFTIVSQGAGGRQAVRRGTVDAFDYARADSYLEFIEEHRAQILNFDAPTLDESVQLYARANGIKGLVETQGGIITNVRVWDQSTVRYVKEPPRVGANPDNVVMQTLPDGSEVIGSFQPTWDNAILGPLRRAGYAEKDIRNFMEIHTERMHRNLESLMDKDFQALARSSRAQFNQGCL